MKDISRTFALVRLAMADHHAMLAKIDCSNKQYKSLQDNYTKAKARQYQQMRMMKRTKHK